MAATAFFTMATASSLLALVSASAKPPSTKGAISKATKINLNRRMMASSTKKLRVLLRQWRRLIRRKPANDPAYRADHTIGSKRDSCCQSQDRRYMASVAFPPVELRRVCRFGIRNHVVIAV